jgi:NIMA (never in mitosis gene a)-related kinase
MPPSTIAPPKTGGATSCSGEYTKLSLIGRGSFGAVWLVRHTKKGGESLVLKEVVTNGLSQSEVRSAKQEINVLKRLSHPNIIGYVTTFEESGTINIVMEFAAGGDLARLIAKRSKEKGARFTETEVRRYATQLASALEYLHREVYLLHRDIKPKNVFLSGVGDVRLGDFGLSKVLSKVDGVAEMQVGTPLYMSPELAAGKPYDRNADVWAFGCTIYEAMSFVPPWNELTTPEGGLEGGMKGLLMHIRAHELDVEALRTNYSLEMVDVVRKLLAKKPSERLPLKVLLTQFTEAPKRRSMRPMRRLHARAAATARAAFRVAAQAPPPRPSVS